MGKVKMGNGESGTERKSSQCRGRTEKKWPLFPLEMGSHKTRKDSLQRIFILFRNPSSPQFTFFFKFFFRCVCFFQFHLSSVYLGGAVDPGLREICDLSFFNFRQHKSASRSPKIYLRKTPKSTCLTSLSSWSYIRVTISVASNTMSSETQTLRS